MGSLDTAQFCESGCLLLWLFRPVGSPQSDVLCRQGCNNLNLNWLAEDVLAVKSHSAPCELFIPVTLLKCYSPLAEHYLVWGESTNIWKGHRVVDNIKFTVRRGTGVRNAGNITFLFQFLLCLASKLLVCKAVMCGFYSFGTLWDRTELFYRGLKLPHTDSPPQACYFFPPSSFHKGQFKNRAQRCLAVRLELLKPFVRKLGTSLEPTGSRNSCFQLLPHCVGTKCLPELCWNPPISSCAEYCASSVCHLGTSDRVIEQRYEGLWSTHCHKGRT